MKRSINLSLAIFFLLLSFAPTFRPPLSSIKLSPVSGGYIEGEVLKFSTPLSLKYLRLLGPRLLRWLSKQRMWATPKL